MNSNNKYKSPSVSMEELEHDLLHLREASKKYDVVSCIQDNDLYIRVKGSNKLASEVSFTVNPTNDGLYAGAYDNYHVAFPRITELNNCELCKDKNLKICYNTEPELIVLFNHVKYGNGTLYTCDYESFLSHYEFSKEIISACHTYIIDYIRSNPKINNLQLNPVISKLLPFV